MTKIKTIEKFREADLQVGDILIFENQDFDIYHFIDVYKKDKKAASFYLLLYLIPWFDPGTDEKNYKNIYHAAIWGNVDVNRDLDLSPKYENRIVQAGTHGIGQALLDKTLKGEGVKNIYVYRYKNKDVDFEKNINTEINRFYNNTSIPYSYETAWLLAVICSMRYSDGKIYEILKDNLGEIPATLIVNIVIQLINEQKNKHEKEMVACSTLVALIFKNAKYPLAIKDFIKNTTINISSSLKSLQEEIKKEKLENSTIPKVSINQTVVTPRQLFESSSVDIVGYLPFKGKKS